jgi:hypothetical protein
MSRIWSRISAGVLGHLADGRTDEAPPQHPRTPAGDTAAVPLHAAAPLGAAQQAVTRVQFGACLQWVAFALRPEMTSAPPNPPNVVHIRGPGPRAAAGPGRGALGPAAQTAVSPRRGRR